MELLDPDFVAPLPLRRVEPCSPDELGPLGIAEQIARVLESGERSLITNLEDHAQEMGSSRKTVQRWLFGLAEQSVRNQHQTLEEVMGYCVSLLAGGQWRTVLYVEEVKHDETPLSVVVEFRAGEPQNHLAKMYMIEQCWGVLLARGDGSKPEDLLWIHGAASPCARVTESGAAETVAKMLQSCSITPAGCKAFELRWRVVETDGLRTNMRAEKVLQHQGHYASPEWATAHTVCAAHQCHHVASRTCSLTWTKATLTGVIQSILTLRAPGAYERFRDGLVQVAQESCVIIRHSNMSPQARQYREYILSLFCPTNERAQAAATVRAVSECLLNANWQDATYVGHVCQGVGCCESHAHLQRKLAFWLPRLLRALSLKTLCRGNWKAWLQAVNFVGFLTHVHSLWQRTFARVFGADMLQEPWAHVGEEHEAEAENEEEEIVKWRRAMSQNLRSAVSFWTETEWPAVSLFILRCVLEPQRVMMGKLLHIASSDWSLQQLESMNLTGPSLSSQASCLSGVQKQTAIL